MENVYSGCKLSVEMLQTLAKYSESIFLAQISDGLIQRKYNKQLCSAAKRKPLPQAQTALQGEAQEALGGDHGIHKELLTSPLDHLHCFEEMLRITKLLPEGDLPPPNAALWVDWFFISFDCLD